MQNPDQTQIFYKAGQTRLTQAKCDLVDPDNPDDPTRLQRRPTSKLCLPVEQQWLVSNDYLLACILNPLGSDHSAVYYNNYVLLEY